MKLRFLGVHNTESQQARMAALLVDSTIAVDAGGLTSSLSFEAQTNLKALLLTHQHYDHVRDVPGIAMSFFLRRATLNVYSTVPVFRSLKTHLLDGDLYPDFFEPRGGSPSLVFNLIEPHQTVRIDRYSVLAVPVIHSVPAVGFQITGEHGESVFYTGDTGPGLFETWRHVSPHVLVIELTSCDHHADFGREAGHLTPELLKGELLTFRELKGYLPRVVAVHMNPDLESEIAQQTEVVAKELGADIVLAYEGMELELPAP